MRAPLSWLKDFVPLSVEPTDRAGIAELGEVLDSLGLVVEQIDYIDDDLAGIVAAQVLAIAPIPGADRIRLVTVFAGAELGSLEIVCGAWNFGVGDVVPLAPVGTTLPNGLTIEKRKMRGVASNGMLCSATELGLGQDSEGLLVLSRKDDARRPEPGTALSVLLARGTDVVFDLAIEPNRPDCLSMIGVARDLAARLSLPFSLPQPAVLVEGPPAKDIASVKVDEPSGCPQLTARVLRGLTDFPSMALVQRRLELCGMRPINAVVDASNYAMFELGQPNHPYDLAKVDGGHLGVRLAHEGEHLTTLDGTARELLDTDLVIVDGADQPVGLAGIIGGESSEITAQTSDVLLEVAQFSPLVLGATAVRLSVRTEAFVRFWRGVDPLGLDRCADRVCALIQEAARVAGAPVPLVGSGPLEDRPMPYVGRSLTLRTARLNALLGTELGAEQIRSYLAPIGFASVPEGADSVVEVASFRPDVQREVDLIEEVARHHGYGSIASRARRSPRVGLLDAYQVGRRKLLRVSQGYGASECWTSSIVDARDEARVGLSVGHVEISNPIVAGETVLRSHLLPGLLTSLRHNEGQRNPYLRLFEVGRVFSPPPQDAERPHEAECFAMLCAQQNDDARTAVAIWSGILASFAVAKNALVLHQGVPQQGGPEDQMLAGLHPSRSGVITTADGEVIGALGEVDPNVAEAFGLSTRRIGVLVFDLQALLDAPKRSILARPVSKYPPSDVDLAFVIDDDVPATELARAIEDSASDLLEQLELVDVYRGANLPQGSRSISYRLRFRAADRTLKDEEIAAARAQVIAEVEAKLPAKLRA